MAISIAALKSAGVDVSAIEAGLPVIETIVAREILDHEVRNVGLCSGN